MQRLSLHLSKCHIFGNHMSWLFFCSFLFLSAFFYFVLPMFLMKLKFTIYKSSFISIVYARYTQLILPKSYMHQGGAILAHIWAKIAFHHFVLIGLFEQYTKFKSKTRPSVAFLSIHISELLVRFDTYLIHNKYQVL